jgi:hypothetical protein
MLILTYSCKLHLYVACYKSHIMGACIWSRKSRVDGEKVFMTLTQYLNHAKSGNTSDKEIISVKLSLTPALSLENNKLYCNRKKLMM